MTPRPSAPWSATIAILVALTGAPSASVAAPCPAAVEAPSERGAGATTVAGVERLLRRCPWTGAVHIFD